MLSRLTAVLVAGFFLVPSVHAQPPAKVRVDSLGDPLPDGAVARLGTLRMRLDSDYGGQFSFSSDGKRAFTKKDGTEHLTVWDLACGKELSPLGQSEKDKLRNFTLSRDRSLLAWIGSKSIQVWSMNTNRKIADFACDFPGSFSFKDNETLVGINKEGSIEFWEIGKGKAVARRNVLAGFEKPKEAKANLVHMLDWELSPDGRTLIAHLGEIDDNPVLKHGPVRRYGLVVVAWDTTTGKELWRQTGKDTGHSFIFSPDSKWFVQLVSWQYDVGEFLCCQTAAGAVKARLPLEKINPKPPNLGTSAGWVSTVRPSAIAPDCKTIAVGKHNSKVVLWDTSGRQPLKEIALIPSNNGRSANIPAVDFSPDGKLLLARVDRHLQLIDLATGKQLLPWEGHRAPVSFVAFSAGGSSLSSGSRKNGFYQPGSEDVLTWSLPAGKQMAATSRSTIGKPFDLKAVSSNHEMSVVVKPEAMWFLDLKSGKMLGKIKAGSSEYLYSSGEFSPLGRHFVLPRGPEPATIFETATGSALCRLPREWIEESVTFSADETIFACRDRKDLIHIASTAGGKPMYGLGPSIHEQSDRARTLGLSPNGKYLASWDSNAILVWNLEKRKEWLRLAGKYFDLFAPRLVFCWSPDGRMLAEVGAASGDVIRLWELSTGKLRCQFSGHDGDIYSLAFSPNGRYLASGSADTTVLIWDLWER